MVATGVGFEGFCCRRTLGFLGRGLGWLAWAWTQEGRGVGGGAGRRTKRTFRLHTEGNRLFSLTHTRPKASKAPKQVEEGNGRGMEFGDLENKKRQGARKSKAKKKEKKKRGRNKKGKQGCFDGLDCSRDGGGRVERIKRN